MIIANGFISIKHDTAQGVDPKTGYPRKPTSDSWGERIECQYSANHYNRLARVLGEARTEQSYEILIETDRFDETVRSGVSRIRLEDVQESLVGEFSVRQIEPLEAVGQFRILI